ncbi:MAG: hypothetical protein IJU57_05435 [Clostridia bacterium]|nr:hypothetical protein [Clostridia bacterium]
MEEKKFNEMLTEVLAGLTGEQKAKAAECKDSNELFEFLGKMGIALPDDLLDNAAGGFYWKNPGFGTGASDQNDGQTTESPDPFTMTQSKRIF